MRVVAAVLTLALAASALMAEPIATDLQAAYQDGQVFIHWKEPEGFEGRLDVHAAQQPITAENLDEAALLAENLHWGLAEDWFRNGEVYRERENYKYHPRGFRITPGGDYLPLPGGLFVHTVTDDTGQWYYAVTGRYADGRINREIVPGVNSLETAVEQDQAPIRPIWQGDEDEPTERFRDGLPLHIKLHGSSGSGTRSYRAFGDASMGWREGLPFCFGVRLRNGAVELRPTDRTWIGRILTESSSGRQKATPAIETWWYGTSSTIHDRERKDEGVPTNYTERQLLFAIEYIQQIYQTDPNRTYGWGSSMGASGLVSFGLRHPEIFTAVRLRVPCVSYNEPPVDEWESKEERIEMRCGDIDDICSDGIPLRERLDSISYVRRANELPYIVVSNGRSDTIMAWWKIARFYKALRETRHGFIAHWNTGGHKGAREKAPEDITAYDDLSRFHHLSLDKSYLAFSNSSADEDPGSGAADGGDMFGSMNRALSWEEPTDTADRYEVLIKADTEILDLPVTVDVTPRRVQQFVPEPGDVVIAKNIATSTGEEIRQDELIVGEDGLLTFEEFTITCPEGNRLVLQ